MFGEFNIIKDHVYFRIVKRTKTITIHTECLHKDNVWKAVQHFVNSGKKAVWYVITPVNFDFVKVEFGCNQTREEWEKTIINRYKWLQEHGQYIEAHVHLRVKMELYESETEAVEDMEAKINGAVSWLIKNGFKPKKIVFGWWSFDEHAARIAEEEGLKVTQRLDYYFIHDYDLLEQSI